MEGCPYRAREAALLRRHFFSRHHIDRLHLEENGSVPRFCQLCGISVSLRSVQRGHVDSKRCKANVRQTRQRERKRAAAQEQARVFTIDGDELKKADNFKYLGRQISSRDSDLTALFLNLSKARKRLTRISRLRTHERWGFSSCWRKIICRGNLISATVRIGNLVCGIYVLCLVNTVRTWFPSTG